MIDSTCCIHTFVVSILQSDNVRKETEMGIDEFTWEVKKRLELLPVTDKWSRLEA